MQDEKLLTRREVEARFGITKRLFELAALHGGGPPMVRIGKRSIRYRPADIRAWLESRLVENTAQTPLATTPKPWAGARS